MIVVFSSFKVLLCPLIAYLVTCLELSVLLSYLKNFNLELVIMRPSAVALDRSLSIDFRLTVELSNIAETVLFDLKLVTLLSKAASDQTNRHTLGVLMVDDFVSVRACLP